MMSMADGEEEMTEADTLLCCACCGIAENDDVKLVPCNGCDLVKYCSDDCKEDHRLEHEEDCKKRAAELRDELLFKQPESSHLGDCPICCLPLLNDITKSALMACCSKVICLGCEHADAKRVKEMRLQLSCPFCREPAPKTKEARKIMMKRVEMNDPNAMLQHGLEESKKGDYRLNLWSPYPRC